MNFSTIFFIFGPELCDKKTIFRNNFPTGKNLGSGSGQMPFPVSTRPRGQWQCERTGSSVQLRRSVWEP